jgi:hypothetical protein
MVSGRSGILPEERKKAGAIPDVKNLPDNTRFSFPAHPFSVCQPEGKRLINLELRSFQFFTE